MGYGANIKNLLLTASLATGLLITGCGGIEQDVCSAAAGHLGTCFGAKAASTYQSRTCDPDAANRVLSFSCQTLGQATSGGKMDEFGLDDAVQDAIRKAVREKVVEALKEALSQLLNGTVGGMLDKYDFYILLYKSDSKYMAESKAMELGAAFASVPDIRPVVVKMDSGWGVVQGNCPISLASDLPERIGDVVESPGGAGLIKALGGSINMDPSEPASCEPSPEPSSCDPDDPDALGCADTHADPYAEPAPEPNCSEKTASFTVHLPLQLYGAPKSYDWPKKLSCTL